MLFIIGQALFFFLPSYVGNSAPVLLDRFSLFEGLKRPIDGGKIFIGQPLFGKTKTWRGIIGGSLAGMVMAGLQAGLFIWVPQIHSWYLFSYNLPDVLLFGFLLGLGEGLGDLIKSFFKRRLHVESTKPFFPFDQLSFLGALILGSFYFLPSLNHILPILILSPLIPVITNLIAFKLGWKKVWW
ncbi:CDP-archaeol synthase [Patescibacteria group bacterium]|nr:CDP-archaeol synthase [Patescibacteria group bacterium]MBU1702909.1 CDP-archaeol synthase [Patescibacteria group bacterium]MBU1954416.1 CDP-archaeol synthase [Patescibacteria group bacterium]